MNTRISHFSEAEFVDRLSEPQKDQQSEINNDLLSKIFSETPRKAAVLVPLLKKEDGWHILFIHRTDDSKEHSGQVAFPGGRVEYPEEPIIHTALREAEEEIGLPSEKWECLEHCVNGLHINKSSDPQNG